MNKQLNSSRFLIAYNCIDHYMRKKLGRDDSVTHNELLTEMITKCKVIKNNIYDLKQYAKLRNAIVHNNIDGSSIAEPHDNIVFNYEKIVSQLIDPPRALDSVAIKDIYTASHTDYVIPIMKDMKKNNYTHVPVILNGKIVGVFSENSIFSYIIENGIALFAGDTKISDLKDIISLDYQKSECFEFADSNTTVYDIDEIFRDGFRNGKRIAAVFLTQNGKQSEKLLGIITPWDMQGYKI